MKANTVRREERVKGKGSSGGRRERKDGSGLVEGGCVTQPTEWQECVEMQEADGERESGFFTSPDTTCDQDMSEVDEEDGHSGW